MTYSTETDEFTTEADPRWLVVLARDITADGKFYYSVRTTGVYCKPSCPSRTAKFEHIAFHATTEAAEAAGFRPCKRCLPNEHSLHEKQTELVTACCRLIESAEAGLKLSVLAKHVGLSPYHFHRIFKAATGLTPKAYAAAHKSKKLRQALAGKSSITESIYQAGYSSNSRFYEKSNQLLGMKASDFKAGGLNSQIRFAIGLCSLGSVLVAMSEKGVCTIALGNDPEILIKQFQDRFPKAELVGGDREFERLIATVVGFVENPQLGLDLPLDIRGTAFQQRVWQALMAIPAGQTVHYSDIAERIGAPKAVRAVASACAANVLAVAIPCHRVIRTDGSLSGYRWGIGRKAELLRRESKT